MMKSKTNYLILLSIFLCLLTGCVEQNVDLPDVFWQNKSQKIAVMKVKAQPPGLYRIGQEGVLDMLINEAVTSQFQNYLKNVDLSWYDTLQKSFIDQLKSNGIHAVSYFQDLETDQKNYVTLAAATNSDELLIIKLNAFGAVRQYYGFIPLGKPRAYCELTGELINPQNNQVIWRYYAIAMQNVQGSWDQPPSYVNFADALNLAAETSQRLLLDSFFRNARGWQK